MPLLFLLARSNPEEPYGITVISNNIKEVIDTHKPLSILFYSSSCEYSTAYRELFQMASIKFKEQSSTQRLAMVDCEQEKSTCDEYKVGLVPTVLSFKEDGSHSKIQEHKLLSKAGIVFEKELVVENVTRWLEKEPHYFVAVLEEEGFEAEKRLQADRLVYLKDSELHRLLLGYTRGRVGCWIFKYDKQSSRLQKFMCGIGMKPKEISSNL